MREQPQHALTILPLIYIQHNQRPCRCLSFDRAKLCVYKLRVVIPRLCVTLTENKTCAKVGLALSRGGAVETYCSSTYTFSSSCLNSQLTGVRSRAERRQSQDRHNTNADPHKQTNAQPLALNGCSSSATNVLFRKSVPSCFRSEKLYSVIRAYFNRNRSSFRHYSISPGIIGHFTGLG